MPRKQQSKEGMLLDYFQSVSLPVAQAQLAMLQAVVARRAQTHGQANPPAKPKGAVTPASVVTPPAPAGSAARGPKPAKKAPGATPGVGPASTAVGGPVRQDSAKPQDVEIPGTRLQEGDPGPHSGSVG